MALAPIILFVYNRPWHTRQTVEALQHCELASDSELYVFADGPKDDATEESLANIHELRTFIHTITGFKDIHIEESHTNKGLANSVISGVTKVIEKHGKVIVVEDDIVCHPFFLRFMNDALEFYEADSRIFTIGGTSINIDIPKKYPIDIFFAPRVESWGWATWKDRWETANWDTASYPIIKHPTSSQIKRLCKGGDDFWEMLQLQLAGKIDSWAVRWQYNMTLQNKMCLFPTHSFTTSIGLDNTGTNCGNAIIPLLPLYDSQYYCVSFTKQIKTDRKIISSLQSIYKKPSANMIQKTLKIIKRKAKKIILGRARKKNNNQYGYFGDYASFQEVLSQCKGYSASNILDKTLQSTLKVKNGEAVFERDSFIFDRIQYSFPLLACLFKVAAECDNSLSVIDFGGALGSHYFQNKEILTPIKIKHWTVVEQPAYVQVGNEQVSDDILHFENHINNVKDANLLLSSSTLQYMEDPYSTAKEFIEAGTEYILLDRIQLNAENRDRLTLQIVPPEIYDAKYPSWFLNEDKLLSIFKEKYNLILDFDSTIDQANIPSYYKGFLFKKKEE